MNGGSENRCLFLLPNPGVGGQEVPWRGRGGAVMDVVNGEGGWELGRE